ncbi:MAG: sigma-54 dependent transcriptional regulator [Woeseiaceae bacterium]|nr:sigma-54 dependent transcriptional regulator [Woeseiaceae bacterium]
MGVRFRNKVIDFGHFAGYSGRMQRPATILVIDDDEDVLTAARLLLRQHFTRVQVSARPEQIETIMAAEQVDVFLLDMNFAIGRNSGLEGLKWLERILGTDPDAVVVLMTAFGDLNTAVAAMRQGAADFVLKPWQNDKLVATLNVAASLRQTRARLTALATPEPGPELVVGSGKMHEVMKIVSRVATTDVNVLIRGENGTGKELVARELHRQSARAAKPLVAVDLGSVAQSLFESELFGHLKGAYTDAVQARAGRFQAAHEGSLFLDEIGNLPPALQTKLLRVLETREFTPLGGDTPLAVDFRLISATNQPLEQMVADGRFREDLLYRINTIEITLPPLRERLDDIPALAAHFMAQLARKYRQPARTISKDGYRRLAGHHWPGNVRELSHAIERAFILHDGASLGPECFEFRQATTSNDEYSLKLHDQERRLVARALTEANGNISHAASALGITRAALYRRMEKFGL